MDKKVYNLDLNTATTGVYNRLYDAAKWCYANDFKSLDIYVSEQVYKDLYSHHDMRGRLGVTKYFPPVVTVLGFTFRVDFNATGTIVDVPLLSGSVTLKDALVFEF